MGRNWSNKYIDIGLDSSQNTGLSNRTQLQSAGNTWRNVRTVKTSTAWASVRALTELLLTPCKICHPKTGLLDSAISITPCWCCRLSSNSLTMLSDNDSGPFATSCDRICTICWQSGWQYQSASGSSCHMHNDDDEPNQQMWPCTMGKLQQRSSWNMSPTHYLQRNVVQRKCCA